MYVCFNSSAFSYKLCCRLFADEYEFEYNIYEYLNQKGKEQLGETYTFSELMEYAAFEKEAYENYKKADVSIGASTDDTSKAVESSKSSIELD